MAPLAASLLCLLAGEATRVKIPGQEVEVSVEIPGFRTVQAFLTAQREDTSGRIRNLAQGVADELLGPRSPLLLGISEGEVTVAVHCRENVPYLTAKQVVDAWSDADRFKEFTVGGVACCEFRDQADAMTGRGHYHAVVATKEYVVDLHVSTDEYSGGPGSTSGYVRNRFSKWAKSLRVQGAASPGASGLPLELWAYRNEAAIAGGDGSSWAEKQATARKDDWVARFYLGKLAFLRGKPAVALKESSRAVDLLNAVSDRTPAHDALLVECLADIGAIRVQQKKPKEAIAAYELLVETAKDDASWTGRRLRTEALYELSCCCVQEGMEDRALAALKEAIRTRDEIAKELVAAYAPQGDDLPGTKTLRTVLEWERDLRLRAMMDLRFARMSGEEPFLLVVKQPPRY